MMPGVKPLPAAVLFLALAALPATAAFAHDDPASTLQTLSDRIALEPGSAALRLERAELHRASSDWASALADLQAASTLDPALAAVDLSLARLMLDSGNLPAARDAADRFVASSPGSVTGHLVRARILVKSGASLDAAAEFTRAIELDRRRRDGASGIQPDDFLARARALDASSRTSDAVAGLDEGLELLGNPVTLQLLAIELDAKRGNLDGALARVASMEAVAKRKESWIARRGDLLAAAGRDADAAEAWRHALEAISTLPPRVRDDAQTLELEATLRRKLASAPSSKVAGEEKP
jgi:predicted negative regulator of RcsB-dependent stress response